jgi:uncharacterized protein (DUF3084 family)
VESEKIMEPLEWIALAGLIISIVGSGVNAAQTDKARKEASTEWQAKRQINLKQQAINNKNTTKGLSLQDEQLGLNEQHLVDKQKTLNTQKKTIEEDTQHQSYLNFQEDLQKSKEQKLSNKLTNINKWAI